jgi:hypothetical protein
MFKICEGMSFFCFELFIICVGHSFVLCGLFIFIVIRFVLFVCDANYLCGMSFVVRIVNGVCVGLFACVGTLLILLYKPKQMVADVCVVFDMF